MRKITNIREEEGILQGDIDIIYLPFYLDVINAINKLKETRSRAAEHRGSFLATLPSTTGTQMNKQPKTN